MRESPRTPEDFPCNKEKECLGKGSVFMGPEYLLSLLSPLPEGDQVWWHHIFPVTLPRSGCCLLDTWRLDSIANSTKSPGMFVHNGWWFEDFQCPVEIKVLFLSQLTLYLVPVTV